jgi:hypothetical protein
MAFIVLLVFTLSAHADNRFIDGVNVVFAPAKKFSMDQEWSDKARSDLVPTYGMFEPARVEFSDKVLQVSAKTPLVSWLWYVVNYAGNFKKMGELIANHCKNEYNLPMEAISCVAESVNATLKQTGWPNNFTFCRSHATAFRAAFTALNIPKSFEFDEDASTSEGGHAVSRFILTSKTGQTYSYVIDVGHYPSRLYPNTPITANWYKQHSEDPQFSFEQPTYRFAPPKRIQTVR